jgi:hypothetical protein
MYPVYNPLPRDHPMVTDGTRCAWCHEPFQAGQITTLIPVDPKGEGGNVVALPAHATCLGWDPHTQRWNDPP